MHVRNGARPTAHARSAARTCLAAILVIAVAGCGGSEAPSPAPPPPTERPPRPLPAMSFTTLDGTSAALADYRGRVLLVNLWGTWCVPCRGELPELVRLRGAYGEGNLAVVGIAVDSGEPEEIRAFADGYGVDYPIWMLDMPTAMAEFGAVGYPFTILVDRDGTIVRRYYGPQTLESLSADIDPLIR